MRRIHATIGSTRSLAFFALASTLGIACTSSDSATPVPGTTSTTGSTGTTAGTGSGSTGTAGSSTGTTATSTGTSSTGATTGGTGATTGSGDAGTLYGRLGGHAGIRAAVEAIVGNELKDPELASFFVFQTTPTAGHPTADQLEECLTDQLGVAAGGSEVFPTTLSADHGGYVCRGDMMAIHRSFHISGAQFDKFVMIAGTTLTALNVATADITTLAGVLGSFKTAIVDPNAPGGPFNPDAGAGGIDAGSGGDAGSAGEGGGDSGPTTLYQRLGAHAGIRSAVEKVVAAELADTTIAPFFSAQTAATTPAGHPTADQLEECLTDQLGAAAGGTETYPVKLGADHGSWQCRDMATIHQSLGIDSATFDKFVMHAATTLTGLGVASADVATVGSVLNGAKPQIVRSVSDAGQE